MPSTAGSASPTERVPQPVALLRTLGRVLLRQPRVLAVLAPVAWALGIHRLSSTRQPLGIEGFDGMAYLANLAHAFEFGVLTVLALPLLPRAGRWIRRDGPGTLLVGFLCCAYAVLDEAHQHRVPGRDASLFDVLTDAVGVAATLMVVRHVGSEPPDAPGVRGALLRGFLACLLAAGLSTAWGLVVGRGLWLG